MISNKKLFIIGIACFILVTIISFNNGSLTPKDPPLTKKKERPAIEEVAEEKKISNDEKIPVRKVYENISLEHKKLVIQFQNQRDELIKELPLVTDLQKLEEGQSHHITPGLIETGKRLSRLKELVLRYPKLKPLQNEANTFYENCADDRDFPTSIRSLCLFSRLQLAKNREEAFDISPYPLEIKQMVLELAPSKK